MVAQACILAGVAALAFAGCTEPLGVPDAGATALLAHREPALGAGPGPAELAPGLHDFRVLVRGEAASGILAVPQAEPTTLAVVAHGWGGDAALHRPDLEALAQAGALAVAMDYRGPRSAFKVSAGVEDTIAATLLLQEEHPRIDRTLLYGWSMGAEVALLAAIEAPAGTYDYVFAGAGVMDLAAFWHENAMARAEVERETGGTPAEQPAAYAHRSPLHRAAELASRGIHRVFLVHGAADGVVPIEHAERMHRALHAAGLPASYYVVTRDSAELCGALGCVESGVPADHRAGRMQAMWPFLVHRIERAPDPAPGSLRGTYDAQAGSYEPSDTA